MMLAAILWIVAGLLILVVAVGAAALCTPSRITMAFDTDAKPAYALKIALFWGVLPVVMPSKRRRKGPRKRKRRGSDTAGRRRFWTHGPRMLRNAPRLLSRLIARVKLETLDLTVRVGLADPADTGVLYGALAPMAQLLSGRTHVAVRPDFDTMGLSGRGMVSARLVPIALLPPILGFAWTTVVAPRFAAARR